MENKEMNKINKITKLYGSTNFFKNIFPEYNIKNKERIIHLGNKKGSLIENFTIIPDYYDDSLNLSNKIYNLNSTASGSYATVFLKYYNSKNLKQKQNIIFKFIKDSNLLEYKALIFNYLLYYYYEKNIDKYPDSLKYLCKIIEIGKIKNNFKYGDVYGIMEYCGKELFEDLNDRFIIKNFENNKNDIPINNMNFAINIFKQCLLSLKLIHDLNYLHLDIKPENYLINIIDDNIQIKIIDFGLINKELTKILHIKGSPNYIANDYVNNYYNGKSTILKKHHDIFSLGCTFITIILSLFNYYNIDNNLFFMCCPIIYANQIKNINESKHTDLILNERRYYKINTHIEDMTNIGIKLLKLNLNEEYVKKIYYILYRMANPNISERFNNIDEILPLIEDLINFNN
jgi:serine/threonine protein kinase